MAIYTKFCTYENIPLYGMLEHWDEMMHGESDDDSD